MATSELSGTTALVTGASRGFGRAITVALHDAGADVVALSRNAERLAELQSQLGGSLTTVAADAADPVVAGQLIEQYRPRTLVLNAGAPPLMRPIQHQTWESFSRFTLENYAVILAPGSFTAIDFAIGALPDP